MPTYVIDTETNGLDNVTKIHVLGWHNLRTGARGVIRSYSEARRFLSQKDLTLICHNLIRYDIPVFEKILGIVVNARLIDTLALSEYLEPYRLKHGLESYGEEFGVPKPVITEGEWLGPLPHETEAEFIAKMTNRVQEDVKINLRTFIKHLNKLKELYDTPEEIRRAISYICYKYECAREQEEVKWRVDLNFTRKTLEKFESEYIRRGEVLSEIMPENILYKKVNKPKVMYKKDGTLSVHGTNWMAILEEIGLEPDHEESLKVERKRERGNPQSPSQLKNWLFSLGWIPTTFKYEIENGLTRKIPQISLPRGEGLCPSVKLLYEVEPRLEELDMYYVIKHRIGLLKGFLRDEVDGYLKAKIAGLTNTLRFKHSVIVNLPGYTGKGDWRDGIHIRGCLIAPEGHVLCGSDMSSLENRTGEHYMYFFDPEYVKERNAEGFDSHTDMAVIAKLMTRREEELFKELDALEELTPNQKTVFQGLKKVRSMAKTVNYSAIYGVGAKKMSLTTGMSFKVCTLLLKAYWKRNWSVKEIAKACIIKRLPSGEMWLFNPVSKFWYSLRYMKDRFSTLNQGTGVYIFDTWVRKNRQKGLKMCGQFHDEVVLPVLIGNEEKTEKILRSSITEINNELGLNRDMDIDVQFGNNYAEIH